MKEIAGPALILCFYSAFQNLEPTKVQPTKETAANVDMSSPELDRPRSPPRRVYGFQVIETPSGRQAGMPCDCPLRCFDKIPVSYRRELLTMFWDLESEAHRDTYLSECILYDEGFFAAPKPGQSVPVMYIIKRGNKAVRVCKRAFLSVFGLHKSGRWRVEALENEVVKVKTEDSPPLQASPKSKRIGRPPTMQIKSKEALALAKKEKESHEAEEAEEEIPMNTRRVTRSRPGPEPVQAAVRGGRGRGRRGQDSPKALTTKPVPKSKRDPDAPLPPEPQAPPAARGRGKGRRSWRGRTRSGRGESQENSEASEQEQGEDSQSGEQHPAQYDGEADYGPKPLRIPPPTSSKGEPLNSLEQEMLNQMDEAIETVENSAPNAGTLTNDSPPKSSSKKPLITNMQELGAKEATLAAAHEATKHVKTLKPGDKMLKAKKESKYMDMMERVEHVEQHIAIYVTGPLEDYKGKYEGEDELINWSEDDIRHWYNHYVQKYCVEQGYQAVSWELYCKLFIKATGVEGPEDGVGGGMEGLTPKERREEKLAELMASLPPPPGGKRGQQGDLEIYMEYAGEVQPQGGGGGGLQQEEDVEEGGGLEEDEEEEFPPDEEEVREAER